MKQKAGAPTKGIDPITPTMMVSVGICYLGAEYKKSLRGLSSSQSKFQ
jgi:hypothetical protein